MKLPVRLCGVLTGLMFLGLVSCGAEADFENRFAADAGDILRTEPYVAETVQIPEKTVPAPATDAETVPADVENEPVIVLPVVETEPETVPPVVETELKTVPPVVETELKTVPPVVETEPETDPPVVETEPETAPPVVETEPETDPPVVETEPETAPPVVETEPETAPPVVITEPDLPAAAVVTVPDALPAGVTFVCNTNSGKYHLPDCGSVEKIKAENIAYLTCAESEIPSGYAPCSVCIAASAAVQKAQIPAANTGTVSYILNTNTMKFHSPICKSVKKIKAENYAEFSGTREEAIASGYDPCGSCKP